METLRVNQTRPLFVKRLTTWSLVLALSALHPLPARTLYHCRVTGARNLPECCCKGTSRCCEEGAASDRGCCGKASAAATESERDEGGRPLTLAADTCGCCDVTYEEGTTPVSALSGKPDGLRRLRELSSFPGLLPQAPDCLPVGPSRGSFLNKLSRAPPGSARPLYILFSSLLF